MSNYAPDSVYEQGMRDALAEAVQRVEALPCDSYEFTVSRQTVIAAIKGDSHE
jgi:hypothetical protein